MEPNEKQLYMTRLLNLMDNEDWYLILSEGQYKIKEKARIIINVKDKFGLRDFRERNIYGRIFETGYFVPIEIVEELAQQGKLKKRKIERHYCFILSKCGWGIIWKKEVKPV
jgi:hypothetical protein